MKTFFFTVSILTRLTIPTCFLHSQDEMTKKDLQDMYVTYLKDNGYSPEIDKDGDVWFKYEGNKLIIFIDESDLEYFSMSKFYNLTTNDSFEKNKALRAINTANSKTKVAKLIIIDDTTMRAQIGLYFKDIKNFQDVFKRCLRTFSAVEQNFLEAYNK